MWLWLSSWWFFYSLLNTHVLDVCLLFSHHYPRPPPALVIDAEGLQALRVIPTVRLRGTESLGSTGAPQTLCCPHSYSKQRNTRIY